MKNLGSENSTSFKDTSFRASSVEGREKGEGERRRGREGGRKREEGREEGERREEERREEERKKGGRGGRKMKIASLNFEQSLQTQVMFLSRELTYHCS